jgi:predicted Zn-dependent peptidase
MEEALLGTAFTAHPYAFPVIGFQSDIDNWSKKDLQDFFKSYYAPNNATVVIAGDVSLAQVKQLANRYFAPIPRRAPPRKIHTVEPEQLGEKRFYLYKPAVSTSHLWMVYHTPATPSPDTYPLQLLSAILSSGESSRLYHRLVDELQIANEVSAYLPSSFDPYLFHINAVAADGASVEKLEKEILSVLQQVVQHGVTERELQKVKNQALMGFYQAMGAINSKAEFVGMYENYFGGVQKLFMAPDEINKVSVADIQRVAQQYLKKSNRTVGVLGNWEDK